MNRTMQPHELEAWVLSIGDRVKSKQPVEDFRVELKSEWPANPSRTARRLAGHCNAAHGEPVLWVVGLDEKKGVVGADRCELPTWFGQVGKQFNGVVPDLVLDLNVPTGDSTAVALLFATDRAPFVVNNPSGGPFDRDVPWREGTGVRSAKREDLLRILVPIQQLPEVDVQVARLGCWDLGMVDGTRTVRWQLMLGFYVIPATTDRLVIPIHRCETRFSLRGDFTNELLPGLSMCPPSESPHQEDDRPLSKTVEATPSELLLDGPGKVELYAWGSRPGDPASLARTTASYSVTLRPARLLRPVVVSGKIARTDKYNRPTWEWRA